MLDSLQTEIDAMGWAVPVHFLGVNGVGLESGNSFIPPLADLPWLQDTTEQEVWASWKVAYRDVVILDEDNIWVATFNLTTHDLSIPANFDALKALMESFAGN